jgi:hypothetical protein
MLGQLNPFAQRLRYAFQRYRTIGLNIGDFRLTTIEPNCKDSRQYNNPRAAEDTLIRYNRRLRLLGRGDRSRVTTRRE